MSNKYVHGTYSSQLYYQHWPSPTADCMTLLSYHGSHVTTIRAMAALSKQLFEQTTMSELLKILSVSL
ncbi:hypothetical protein J6590_095754 [Homalodisca vitripennis]|nr:hypothetical protein J6590_095754 [Homalodisca vitripennis]